MTNETRPADSPDQDLQPQPRPRFIEPGEPRRAPLGRVRTEEEAMLAAEIEKLRE